MPDRDSKQQILAAAEAEFAALGYAGARTQRIAHHAGVNKQLIFYYFQSKRGLYEAVLALAAAALSRKDPTTDAHTSLGSVADLRSRLRSTLHGVVDRPDWVRLLTDPGGPADPAMQLLREVTAEVCAVISAGQGVGYFRDDADPARAARQLVVLALGYLALEGALEPAAGGSHRTRWVDDAIELVVHGMMW